MTSKDENKIFKPVPINEQNKPIKNVSIFIDGNVPNCLKKKTNKAAYKIFRDKNEIADVPVTFPKKVREDMEKVGYSFITTERERYDNKKVINGVNVVVRSMGWETKCIIIINKGTIQQIIDGVPKVLNYLHDKCKIDINSEDICTNYCGIEVNIENIDRIKNYIRK